MVDKTPKTPEPVPLQSDPQEPDTPQVLRALVDSPDTGTTHCADDTGQVVESGPTLDARAAAQEKKQKKYDRNIFCVGRWSAWCGN